MNKEMMKPGSNSRTNRELLSQIYEESMPAVFRYLNYRLGNTSVAEDLTSTVFEKAVSAFHTFDPEKAPARVWLLTIARNTLTDYFRKNGDKQLLPIDAAESLTSADPLPGEDLEKREQADRLRYCLSKLSKYEQELVSLKFGLEITNRRIATMVGISDSNVGTILFRAVRKLRECFEVWLNGKGK